MSVLGRPTLACIAIGIAVLCGRCTSWAADEYRAPVAPKAPTIDGHVGPAEWALAVGFDGFSSNGRLEERRIRAYVGATETALYFAFVSELPPTGGLLSSVAVDTPKIVYDDSIEVWIDPTPGQETGRILEMMANPTGHVAYICHKRGAAPEEPNWRGNYRIANGFHKGSWHCEVEVPIEQIAPRRRASEGSWGINLCRNWKQPWSMNSLGSSGYPPDGIVFTFAPDGLAVAYENRTDPTTGDINGALKVHNPSRQDVTVKADLLLSRDVMPEVHDSQSLTVPAGQTWELPLRVSDQATKEFALEASVTSADGQRVYYGRSYTWEPSRGPRWDVVDEQVVLPVDFHFSYYPYLNRMRVLADWSGLEEGARLERLDFAIRERSGRKVVSTVAMTNLRGQKQEMTFDLPPLSGEYEIAMTATGQGVPADSVVKTFERTVYEWEHNNLGRSAKVYPPFTPIRVQGQQVETVLRRHEMTDWGLWQQVTSTEKDLLDEPMTYRAVIAGQELLPSRGTARFIVRQDNQAIAEGEFSLGPLRARTRSTWDYDGMMRVDLELQPTGGQSVESLDLEIPLKTDMATHYHAMGDGIRNTLSARVPAGDGVVWSSEQVNANDFPAGFCTYIYVGTPVRGLCWFAENDRGWSWDRSKPNVDLVRRDGQVLLRVHLVNKPLVIAEPRTITFGLLAAPVKPRLPGWRWRWIEDSYALLGTDINWFALGTCGSVYPAHKDMRLWEALAEGNQRKLSDQEVETVVEYGRKYWEPYGPESVEGYERHVRYNLRQRYGKTMVFYYNRASFQLADEFQTFMDEWCLDDYRENEKGDGIWEIKIVPSESYVDHALWWYGKSFDIGHNRGVYWDNWFFCASYNRMMTGAYEREDGSIMPSTGLWGLRELSKRTFQYMNERGMTPITFPHMTSTNILPLHSFATVQYDWEWHYSEGDVQNRYTRDYILLATNGDLAGTWPVVLWDQGKLAEDQRTQRTFAGVCLVHEIIGGGLPQVWDPLRNPIIEIVKQPDVEVYRYWDERPQPVVASCPDLPTIVFSLKGREAIVVITSYSEQDETAEVTIDPATLGFVEGYAVTDVETGERLPVTMNRLRFPLQRHDVREFRITTAGGGRR